MTSKQFESKNRRTRILKLIESGVSYAEIADAEEVCQQYVSQVALRSGIRRNFGRRKLDAIRRHNNAVYQVGPLSERQLMPDSAALEKLRNGYDPEQENGAPRRSDAFGVALGWQDSIAEQVRERLDTSPSRSVASAKLQAQFANKQTKEGRRE